MENAIIYLRPNSGISEEQIACGFVFILDDGTSLFRWSRKKLSIFNKLLVDSKDMKSSIRSLCRLHLNGIERYAKTGEKGMRSRLEHMRIHGNGLLSVGEFYKFILPVKDDVNKSFDVFFNKFIENE